MFTRKISAYLTWLFLVLGASANLISVVKGIVSCAGALLFLPGDPSLALLGAFLLQLSFVLDACDGEVARYTNSCGYAGGEFIDKIGDALSKGFFYGAWSLALFQKTGSTPVAIAGFIMAGGWLVVRFCQVETLLESFSHHPELAASDQERDALRRLFVRKPGSGRVEFFFSVFVHPWLNIAFPVAVSMFFPHSVMLGLFWLYAFVWAANWFRKTVAGFRIVNFRRPVE